METTKNCPLCDSKVTGIAIDNNVQTVFIDKAGYDVCNGLPIGKSGRYEPHYYSGRREKIYLPCGHPVLDEDIS